MKRFIVLLLLLAIQTPVGMDARAQVLPDCIAMGRAACQRMAQLEADFADMAARYNVSVEMLRAVALYLGVDLINLDISEVLTLMNRKAGELAEVQARLALLTDSTDAAVTALRQEAIDRLNAGDLEGAKAVLLRIAEARLAEIDRSQRVASQAFLTAALIANSQGNFDEALTLIERASAAAPVGEQDIRFFLFGLRFAVLLGQAEAQNSLAIVDSARAEYDEVQAELLRIGAPPGAFWTSASADIELAEVYLRIGRRTQSDLAFQRALDIGRSVLMRAEQQGGALDRGRAHFYLAQIILQIVRADGLREQTSLLTEGQQNGLSALPLLSAVETPFEWVRSKGYVAAGYAVAYRDTGNAEYLSRAFAAYQEALAAIQACHAAEPSEDIEYLIARRCTGDVERAQLERDYGGLLLDAQRPREAAAQFRAALTTFTQDAWPEDWATLQESLGDALVSQANAPLTIGDVDQGINAYQQALIVLTREHALERFIAIQTKIGSAQMSAYTASRDAARLQSAHTAYRGALDASPPETRPLDWSDAQLNLGRVYLEVAKIDGRWTTAAMASATMEVAVEILDAQAQPRRWGIAHLYLGQARLNLAQAYHRDETMRSASASAFDEAFAAFETARTTIVAQGNEIGVAAIDLEFARGHELRASVDAASARLHLTRARDSYATAAATFARLESPFATEARESERRVAGLLATLSTQD